METMFEAKRIMTKKLALELAVNKESPSVYVYFILMFALPTGTILYYIINDLYYYGYFTVNISGIILLLLVIAYCIYRPHSIANNRIKYYEELYKATETDYYYFYDEYFINRDENSKNELTIEYKRIADVKCTKNAYLLKLSDSKTLIELPKNDFTKGSSADFITFFNSRIIKSKRKIK